MLSYRPCTSKAVVLLSPPAGTGVEHEELPCWGMNGRLGGSGMSRGPRSGRGEDFRDRQRVTTSE